jgi:hypothetical protein
MANATKTKQVLGNVRSGGRPIDTTPLQGTETPLMYLQLTGVGADAEANGTHPHGKDIMYGQAAINSLEAMGLSHRPTETAETIMFGRCYVDKDQVKVSLYLGLVDTVKENQHKQEAAATLVRLADDTDRAVFRGIPRGPLASLFDQVELRVETCPALDENDQEIEGEFEDWLLFVGISV